MVLLPTLKIVRVVQNIATQHLGCFVFYHQTDVQNVHVMQLMEMLKIPTIVHVAQMIVTQRLVCSACPFITNVRNARAWTKCSCLVLKSRAQLWAFTHGPEAAVVVNHRIVDQCHNFCTGLLQIQYGSLDRPLAVPH